MNGKNMIVWLVCIAGCIQLIGVGAVVSGYPDSSGFQDPGENLLLSSGPDARETWTIERTASVSPPASPVKLIFIHHSTGQNWLDDGNGGLGIALRDNNYFVSDTNYGWGPDSIGDRTDIPDWHEWFRGSKSAGFLYALFNESGQHSAYSRLDTDPGGPNRIVMFKSCFPNSAITGNPWDPVPPIAENPLDLSFASSKGVYIDLLDYFATKPDTLFIVITAPPLSDATYSANARAFNQWLIEDWLRDYPCHNVFVFDFYNVLTSNGGDPDTNDLNLDTGSHHRWWDGSVQHQVGISGNTSAYPTGDDHPSQAGNLKATAEFVPLLNYAYNRWSVPATRIGIFRPSTHLFYLDVNGNGVWNGAITDRSRNFGITGDIPVTGDWNNDGTTDIGVFRPSTHLFYLDYNGNGVWNGAVTDRSRNFGITGDIPITGDWNNDGTTDIGVFRPSTHLFYLDYNGNGVWNGAVTDRSRNFGITGDIPITGDWNNDGTTDIGVFRPSTHLFYLDYNGNGVWNGAATDRSLNFGITGDIPVTGDWNNDGITDIGVFRPSTHLFYLDYNGNGVWNGAVTDRSYNFGITGDTPISGTWS
jgi:hypothetical protein